jgi:hypothetical protein
MAGKGVREVGERGGGRGGMRKRMSFFKVRF